MAVLLCRWYNSISNSYRCTVKLQSSFFEINLKVGASNIGGKEYGQVLELVLLVNNILRLGLSIRN
jgi:hypothetical protein